jgi:hypothetical protein
MSKTNPLMKGWRVAKPGTHGPTLRVVRDIGININGVELARAVCEISTCRNSDGQNKAAANAVKANKLEAAIAKARK